MISMSPNHKIRDPDEWWEEKYLLYEEEIGEGNKIRVLEDAHYDSDTEEAFWHGIQIQRVSKTRSGRWMFREKLNIPYDKFSEFCDLILMVKQKHFR